MHGGSVDKKLAMEMRHLKTLLCSTFLAAFLVPVSGGLPGSTGVKVLAGDRVDDGRTAFRRNYNIGNSGSERDGGRASIKTKIVNDGSVGPMLTPESPRLMQAAIDRYRRIVEQGGWPRLPANARIVPGTRGPAVALLRRRLAAEGYMRVDQAADDSYDKDLANALREFQRQHGLVVDGRVGPQTRRELSVSAEERLETLRVNLPRIAEYVKNLKARYIVVNIPAAQLDAVSNGHLFSRHVVIAGKTERPSPVLASNVTELNFNPYWNAPASIVQKDIIPKVLKEGPKFLDGMNIRVYDGYGGPEVDPATLDWQNMDPERYHFRQEPGEENAMASVKINFPNKYAVYMHDTPTKQLFTRGARYFSSGCVRVDKVDLLVDWILNGQEGWDRERVKFVEKSGERLDVKVLDKPSLRFAYLTAWVTRSGRVHFRDDIYKLDGTGFVVGQPLALTSG